MLYYCSRSSVYESFNKPVPLSPKLIEGFYAATFSGDELTIYASKDGEIYTAKRNSLSDDFTKPTIVTGLAEGRKFAPSISADGNELIVIFDHGEKDIAIHYRKNATGDFIEVSRLSAPGKRELEPGQFSKDGLSFYASYEVKDEDGKSKNADLDRKVVQKIIRFTRRSLADNFTTIEEVPEELNFQMRNHQPTMNKDETIFVVVNSEEDSWGQNELRLVNLNKEVIVEDAVQSRVDTISATGPIICYVMRPEEFAELAKKMVDSFLKTQTETSCCNTPDAEQKIVGCNLCFEEIAETQFIFNDTSIELATSKPIIFPEIISRVKIYPNPFTDILVITLEKNDINSNFELFDISGRKIMTTKLNNSINSVQFNRPGAGIYIYRLTNCKGKVFATGKLIRK